MSDSINAETLTARLSDLLDLDASRARALAELLEDELLGRLASRAEIAALDQRVATLVSEIEASADVILKHLSEAIAATPSRTKEALDKPLQGVRRSLSDEISRLQSGSWLVFLAVMLLSLVVARFA